MRKIPDLCFFIVNSNVKIVGTFRCALFAQPPSMEKNLRGEGKRGNYQYVLFGAISHRGMEPRFQDVWTSTAL